MDEKHFPQTERTSLRTFHHTAVFHSFNALWSAGDYSCFRGQSILQKKVFFRDSSNTKLLYQKSVHFCLIGKFVSLVFFHQLHFFNEVMHPTFQTTPIEVRKRVSVVVLMHTCKILFWHYLNNLNQNILVKPLNMVILHLCAARLKASCFLVTFCIVALSDHNNRICTLNVGKFFRFKTPLFEDNL